MRKLSASLAGKIRLQVILLPICLIAGSPPAFAWIKSVPANEYGESGDAKGTYFHLYAKYSVGGSERLVFDLQISCGTHTFEDGRLVHGYLPALYAKETASGAAVMLATPRVCDAIRFAEDRPVADDEEFRQSWKQVVEGNFIPFTIWFEDASNLTHGFGYAAESAFDNPASPLTFVDAWVEPSSERAFSRWYKTEKDNLLKEFQIGPRFVTGEDDKAYWATFDPEKKLLPLSCTGVAITPFGEDQREVEQYYPTARPRYWLAPEILPDTRNGEGRSKLDLVPKLGTEYYASSPSQEFPIGYNYLRLSERDSKSDSLSSDELPDYYPAYRSDDYPFAGKGTLREERLTVSVDLRPERKGLLSCASPFNPLGYGMANFGQMYEHYFGPGYGERLVNFGKVIDLEIIDERERIELEGIPQPLALPHFLIEDKAAAEFVTFDFFGGGHVE